MRFPCTTIGLYEFMLHELKHGWGKRARVMKKAVRRKLRVLYREAGRSSG